MSVRKFSTASILSPAYKNSKIWDGETFPGYFESIATVVVPSAGQALITFDNIPQNYTHLQVRYMARSTRNYSGNSSDVLIMTFNTDKNALNTHWLYGNGTSAAATTNNPYISVFTDVSGGSTFTNPAMFGVGVIDILDYTNTNKYKTVRCLSGYDTNGGPNNGDYGTTLLSSSMYDITSAVSKITFSCLTQFMQYSHFALYGIRSA